MTEGHGEAMNTRTAGTALSRRAFLRWTGALIPTFFVGYHVLRDVGWAAGSAPAKGLKVLSAEEWRTVAALLDHIFPKTTGAPSATEADVPSYLSRALSGEMPGWRIFPAKPGAPPRAGGYAHLAGHYQRAVQRLDALARETHGKPFAALTMAAQGPVVARFAEGAKADVGYNVLGNPDAAHASDRQLFELIRRHAIEGYLAEPRHGGNKNYVAWEAVGHTCHVNYPKERRCPTAKS